MENGLKREREKREGNRGRGKKLEEKKKEGRRE